MGFSRGNDRGDGLDWARAELLNRLEHLTDQRKAEQAPLQASDPEPFRQAAHNAADSVALLGLTFTAIPEPPPVPHWRQKREQEAARNLHRRGRR